MCMDVRMIQFVFHNRARYLSVYHESGAKREDIWVSQLTWLSRVYINGILRNDRCGQWYLVASACDNLSFPDLQSVRHGLQLIEGLRHKTA